MPLHPGPEWRIFRMPPLWVLYCSMTSRFPPFAFVELVSPYKKKNITRWLEDMNFMFSWQEQYLTRLLRSLVRYCSCHLNIKFISSCHCVISSMYFYTFNPFMCVLLPTIYTVCCMKWSMCLNKFLFWNASNTFKSVNILKSNHDSYMKSS